MLKYEHYFVDEYTGEIATYEWQLSTGNHYEIWYFKMGDLKCEIIHKPHCGYECDSIEWPTFQSAAQYIQALCLYTV